ncbi:arylsulfotransferase family protein [Halorussus sp. MSC15.2]|uniref:arylsulfotransferase family protein n=1 Tax=Halorussus sp. MSC15.2 TaxID=2283638 RepID=UPI0013D1F8FA|nr:arylsulfotransferase family protein [Halorussus sp. MSC15.2]NEU58043.1 hypothetical protein [Halorussus sp. MSC15.2]
MVRPTLPTIGRPSRTTAVRSVFAVLLLLSVLLLAGNYVTTALGTSDRNAASLAGNGVTVLTEQTGPLEVYGPNETELNEYERYARYWDVDESPVGSRTLLYTATKWVPKTECDWKRCRRNVVGRLNLTTGEHTELFSRIYSDRGSNEWHDADRVNGTHVAVAGIRKDRVFFADVESDRITWQWHASERYPRDIGRGQYDWTHLNDVEVLDDGRVMASVRNMDEVVFIRPGRGVIDDWTLGSNDNYDVLYEQHNMDYIPRDRGGPAVIVSDSHNNRIVEFQRVNDQWRQSWVWKDAKMQWTRDGDRMPNGHTLITDTNGDRVFEVNERGEVVWLVETTKAYEAERLGTGDESRGGQSAAALGLPSHTTAGGPSGSKYSRFTLEVWQLFSDNAPPYILNSILFVLPPWIDPVQFLPLGVAGTTLVSWSGIELYWRVDWRRLLPV